MGELLYPVFTEPTKPVRRYYVHLERDAVMSIPRDQTTQRMHTDQGTLNVPVEDELDWKLYLAEYTSDRYIFQLSSSSTGTFRVPWSVCIRCVV